MAKDIDYRYPLDHDAQIVVRFTTERDEVVRYRVVLLAVYEGEDRTVRLFDNAHGVNDMHRYEGAEKQEAETFSQASPREAMYEAIRWVLGSYREMIDAWAP
jgi:hypothetical protein